MNSEQLYEYLTESRNVSGGQKKLIRNAVNYAAGISRTEEQRTSLWKGCGKNRRNWLRKKSA